MLITDSRNKLRQFQVSYRPILGIAIIAAFLFISNILLTTSFVKSQVAGSEIERLKSENSILSRKFQDVQSKLGQISTIYDDLVKKEVIIRNMFNLPEIGAEERQLGIGGPENLVFKTFSQAVELANSSSSEVEALLRLAHFEKEKYQEVYGVLTEKKSLLDHTPSISPTVGYQIRGFGMKTDPFTGVLRFHGGIDISNRTGTPIYATADGIVKIAAFDKGGLGNMITIDHGNGVLTRYGHMSKLKATIGQKVKRGTLIGYMGSTGYSTGPHLHYEVIKDNKPVNPLNFIISMN
jgi:murein DD-endopeptidase MepM/ murein hydrolase activator NlpD